MATYLILVMALVVLIHLFILVKIHNNHFKRKLTKIGCDTAASILYYFHKSPHVLDVINEIDVEHVDTIIINERNMKINGKMSLDEENIIDSISTLKNGLCKASNGNYIYSSKSVNGLNVISYSRI